jgi:hypothetical protein
MEAPHREPEPEPKSEVIATPPDSFVRVAWGDFVPLEWWSEPSEPASWDGEGYENPICFDEMLSW